MSLGVVVALCAVLILSVSKLSRAAGELSANARVNKDRAKRSARVREALLRRRHGRELLRSLRGASPDD